MNVIRVQIHLKYMTDGNLPSKLCYNFWYAFEPSKLLTINDIIEDIRINYLKSQLLSSIEDKDDDDHKFIMHLNDCELLPFTSSGILRENDKIIFMPLKNYKLYNKSLQDSVDMNLSSSMVVESSPPPPPQPSRPSNLSEKNPKKQRIESTENNIVSESTLIVAKPIGNADGDSSKMPTKAKITEDQVVTSSTTKSTAGPQTLHKTPHVAHSTISVGQSTTAVVESVSPVGQSTPSTSRQTTSVLKESIIEEETSTEEPRSYPSNNVRIRELKSKTPTWKAQAPSAKGSVKDKVHIRFDSESDEEPPSQMQTVDAESTVAKTLSSISDSTICVQHVPTTMTINTAPISNETKNMKKTIDLLFEMKQHKTPNERQGKKIQQQFAKKRSQHRKRALDYFSMANFVDQAFGIEKHELEKQISPNGYQTSASTTPQTLPTSFNKLARLPLVAEAIENNDKAYDLYPPVIQCPSVQTRIAFKLLELGEDFCPKMSSYKEGTVINIDQNTGELTIQLDKALQTVFDQPTKFYAPTEEEPREELTTLVLPFSDLNGARLLSTSKENPEPQS